MISKYSGLFLFEIMSQNDSGAEKVLYSYGCGVRDITRNLFESYLLKLSFLVELAVLNSSFPARCTSGYTKIEITALNIIYFNLITQEAQGS